ncbi:DUF5659 domain-containing protein [Ureibacillus chungkukjangi]|uniref:DUF5659 domain-containing protein n=1 Tax=Ureibacillus chungkukjangi TaxID=1202712 RepID=UPI00203DA836|nr:DUF5659 domain-containing protein [Ureibacillus chungkukjangi]MCM3387361.1 DUF5659 domain-containing protein [Ureibacillus chungkukjangi]
MNKEHIVFSQYLAGTLMRLGFVLKRVERTNKENSRKNIFIFNETDELLQAITDYKNGKIK